MLETITSLGKRTIKQIFEDNNNWENYLKAHLDTPAYAVDAVEKMLNCRNPEKLGYHKYCCPDHPSECVVVPHSCKSRFCNSCAVNTSEGWINRAMKDFPDIGYYHITLTVPDYLWYFFKYESRRPLLELLFKSSREAVLEWFLFNRKVKPGIISVLHTFGKKANFNTHIHMIVAAAGLDLSKPSEKRLKKLIKKNRAIVKKIDGVEYILKRIGKPHYPALSKRWRASLVNKISKYIDHDLESAILRKNWYLHVKPGFHNAQMTIQYIGRYTKRPPMAQTRITNYDGNFVTFFYEERDEMSKIKIKKFMRLPVEEFIERLISHIPLPNFKMIRHYGFLSNRAKSKLIPIVFDLLNQKQKETVERSSWRERQILFKKIDPLICKTCKKAMVLTEMAFWSKKMDALYIKNATLKIVKNLLPRVDCAQKPIFEPIFTCFERFSMVLNLNYCEKNLRPI